MKKLILSAAILLGSISAFAQQSKVETKKAKTTTEQIAVTQEATTAAASAETMQQNPYKEITVDQVPETIKTALTKAYPDATIDKGYVNEANQYKIEITNGEQKGSLMADATGKWLEN
jgi:hypothetical protein